MTVTSPTPDTYATRTPRPVRRTIRPLPRFLVPATGIAVAVLLWWVATTVLVAPPNLLAAFAPQRALPALADLATSGVLLDDVLTSLRRLLGGLMLAGLIGLAVGLTVGSLTAVDDATRPVFQFLRMISPLSWAPVAIGLFGIGHRPVVFLVAAAAVWPVVMNTVAGVRSVEPGHVLAARSLGAARGEVLTSVVLPTIRPHVLTGLRLALGIAWVVLVPAEMLGVTSGLGYEVLNSRDQLAYDKVMAVILVIGLLGYLLDTLARRLLRPA